MSYAHIAEKTESEELNMDKNMDWFYRAVPMDPDLERTLEAVEKALGFKLFVWQKTGRVGIPAASSFSFMPFSSSR